MKKLFYIIALTLGLVGFAQASSFEIGAGATTNKVQHGQSISARGFSANLNASGKTDVGIAAQYGLDTVSIVGNGATLQHTVAVSYGTTFADTVGVVAGVRERLYTGGATTVAASTLNYGELFAGATAYGLTAEVRSEKQSKNLGVEVGYKHSVAQNCAAHAGYEYINYGNSPTVYHGYQLGADYSIAKNLTASLDYTHAGNAISGSKLPNQVAVSVAYLF